MRHLWSDFLVVSAHQSGQRHFSTRCGSKRQDSECLTPRASICHDSPQQLRPPAPCPVHVHISLKIQARRHSRKMCVVAGHLTLPSPTYGELGQARHEPQTLSCLWHRSGWRPAPSTPPLLPSGSHRGPASSLGCLQARGNPSASFPREKQAEIQINGCLRAAPDQSRIKLSTSCFLSWCWFPTPTQTRPGPAFQVADDLPMRNIPGPAYQCYLTITACGREERKGEGRNEREEDSKEGSGGWERKQRREMRVCAENTPSSAASDKTSPRPQASFTRWDGAVSSRW